jgi:hypothetical protein
MKINNKLKIMKNMSTSENFELILKERKKQRDRDKYDRIKSDPVKLEQYRQYHKQYSREYRKTNADKLYHQCREWRLNNPDRHKELTRKYLDKIKNDPILSEKRRNTMKRYRERQKQKQETCTYTQNDKAQYDCTTNINHPQQ